VATVEKVSGAEAGRRPRADAARNRARLLDAAKAVFAAKGAEASLEAIARAAGGNRHALSPFPTRDALIEAVYRNETDQLGEAARRWPPNCRRCRRCARGCWPSWTTWRPSRA
jgi:AcrR family transcriptional regulator